jgi:hypothetical protein
VDSVDDFAAVDSFEVDAGDSEVGVAELALDDDERGALSGHLNRVRVAELARGEAAADAGGRCEVAQRRSSGGWRPRASGCRTPDDAEKRTDGHRGADLDPAVDVFPRPGIHAGLASAAALASADEDAASLSVEVALREGEGLADPQSWRARAE